MLVGLTIRDVVLIEELQIGFADGLCALTGETGAGKSILLDALGLALGARADSALVRHGARQASVTAEFDLPGDHPAFALMAEHELDAEPPLILRRTLNADGRSRAFANDQPVSITLIRQLGETLVEVHGQFDTHGLMNPQTHRGVLDASAELAAAAGRVEAAWRDWRRAEARRAEAAEEMARARAEEDWLRHAVAELDELAPEPGEADRLAGTRETLMHAEKLVEAIRQALDEVAGDNGADAALGRAQRALERVAEKAGGRLDNAIAPLDRAAAELGEASVQLQAAAADLDLDPRELEAMDERLFALRGAARKFGCEVDALADLRADLARRLDLIEDQGDALERLAAEVAAAREAYVAEAEALSEARRAAAGRLDAAVAGELPPLKLDKARFETRVERQAEGDWGPTGLDRVQFAVTTNPGAPAGPLSKIASGGELARFMLALKVVLAESRRGSGGVPTLIFDEVDSGIGGATAAAVGERLARLADGLQVLVVTHSPQVAARAGHHWQVRKAEGGAEAVTTTVVRLDADQRREEIARMLSGATVTDQARAAADSLLAGAG
ncbi:MAG: DNA repair protein RecN [Azospirillaceae bacterium]